MMTERDFFGTGTAGLRVLLLRMAANPAAAACKIIRRETLSADWNICDWMACFDRSRSGSRV